jgi:hypothetical protein
MMETASGGVKEAGEGGMAISREAMERAETLRRKAKNRENAKNDRNLQGPQHTQGESAYIPRQIPSVITNTTVVTATMTTTSVPMNRAAGASSKELGVTASKPVDKSLVHPVREGPGEVARPAKKLKTAFPAKEDEDKDRAKDKKKRKKAKKGDEFDDLFKELF